MVFLMLLASFNLFVGVSNDAVNFLSSALGSKSARYNIVMGVAAAGVLLGCTFSSGMMEIARSGIFNPQPFYLLGRHAHLLRGDADRCSSLRYL